MAFCHASPKSPRRGNTSFKLHSYFIHTSSPKAISPGHCVSSIHSWFTNAGICSSRGQPQHARSRQYFIHTSFILHLQKGCCHGAAFLFIFVVLRRVNWQRRWHCVMSAPAATLQTILHLNFIHTSFPEHPLLRIRSLSCVGARPIVLCGEEVPLNMFLGMGGMWVV